MTSAISKNRFLSKFFGDKSFYKSVIKVVLPIFIQNLITTFVGLLDNVMIGSLGTEEMSGVAISN
ncbi:MAG: MATE family efflux transporter, partial [Clostridia bacterium]|nr:MATE family efflux transporter [Clostridia bacterium]